MRRRTFFKLAVATWPVLLSATPAPLGIRQLAAEPGGNLVAVADFDYNDTSGEVTDQRAEHATRVDAFSRHLRDRLAAEGKYKVLHLDCGKVTCSAGSVDADDLVAAARDAGAQLLIYGGIQKMSTLIAWVSVRVVDVRQKQLLLNRLFSFRGDTDEAFARAAKFISETLQDVAPAGPPSNPN